MDGHAQTQKLNLAQLSKFTCGLSHTILVPRATRLSLPRDQETTGSGDENGHTLVKFTCVRT